MDNAYRKAVEAAQDKRDNDAWESHLAGLAEPWDMEEAPEAEDE